MIRLRNLTGEEIKAIGRSIGRAFYDEGEGLFTRLDREDAITALEIMTECYYRLGVLYATSERQEGYLAYWRKGEAKEWGMKKTAETTIKGGGTMYTMERDYRDE